jgi:hypothetical protein
MFASITLDDIDGTLWHCLGMRCCIQPLTS